MSRWKGKEVMKRSNETRVVFLDWLRVIACFMVMVVHACEAFYFNDAGETCFRSPSDARWAVGIDSACRAAVPLFVIASSFLLFPLKRATGDFFRRRLVRVVVPFLLWSGIYIVWNALNFDKGVSCDVSALGTNFARFFFNFPMTTGGHLWFVPMLLGLYLVMPLLSPWAEKVTEKELRGWILLWLLTTLFPFVRKLWACWFASGADAVSGTFWSHTFGLGDFEDLPFLWGECPWNSFGTFQYVSGFFGYLLIGLYLRKFLPQLNWRQTLSWAIPLWTVGYAIVAGFFYFRIPFDGTFPLTRPYALAVDLEMSWEFCSLGVALTVIGYVLVLRKLDFSGWFYAHVVRPVSEASYGTYLMHMLVLAPVVGFHREAFSTPVTIVATAATTYVVACLVSVVLRRIPVIGRSLV